MERLLLIFHWALNTTTSALIRVSQGQIIDRREVEGNTPEMQVLE